jgi:hypothetical protein
MTWPSTRVWRPASFVSPRGPPLPAAQAKPSLRFGCRHGAGLQGSAHAKLEYNYIDFGSENVTLNSSNGTQSFVRSSETVNIVKAGVNYRFNWGNPLVAKY